MFKIIIVTVSLIVALVTLRLYNNVKTRRRMKKASGKWINSDNGNTFEILRKGCRSWIVFPDAGHELRCDNSLLFFHTADHAVTLLHNPASDRITMMPGGQFQRIK